MKNSLNPKIDDNIYLFKSSEISEIFEIGLRKKIFFKAKNYFSNFGCNNSCENKIKDKKKLKSIQRNSFQQNRFYSVRSIQRPSARVGVKEYSESKHRFFKIKLYK